MAFRRTGLSPSLSGTCVPSSGEDFRSQIEPVAAVVGLRVAAAVVAAVVAAVEVVVVVVVVVVVLVVVLVVVVVVMVVVVAVVAQPQRAAFGRRLSARQVTPPR